MIIFLFGVFLIVLGVVAAASFVEAKIPAAIPYIIKLKLYEEGIGVAAMFLGLCGLINFVFNIGYWFYAPAMGLLALVSTLLTLALGVVLGLVFISKRLRDPAVSFPILPRLEGYRARLLPYKKVMGETSILLGIIYIVLELTRLF
jgi:hypothetical protein